MTLNVIAEHNELVGRVQTLLAENEYLRGQRRLDAAEIAWLHDLVAWLQCQKPSWNQVEKSP